MPPRAFRSHTRIIVNGRQVYEAPAVQPVFLDQEQAIDHTKGAAASTVCKGNNGVTFLVLHAERELLND